MEDKKSGQFTEKWNLIWALFGGGKMKMSEINFLVSQTGRYEA